MNNSLIVHKTVTQIDGCEFVQGTQGHYYQIIERIVERYVTSLYVATHGQRNSQKLAYGRTDGSTHQGQGGSGAIPIETQTLCP
jgi:hypothetical protein